MKHLAFGVLLLLTSNLAAQTLTQLDDIRSYFNEGLHFEHAPSQTKARFRFRMQNRFTYETEDADNLAAELVDFSVRRFRLRLEGNVWDKRLLYRVQLSFTRGDFDYDRTNYPNVLRDAVIGWKLSDATTLWYGQTKLPGNRQRVVSSGAQQLVDRSLLNATFNIDRDLGAQLFHRMGEEKPLWVKLAVSNGGGRSTENIDNGLAYTARIEWLPLGAFSFDGDYFEGDLAREVTPKISFGTVYSLNKKAQRPGGQIGREFPAGVNRDMETWFADALFKYRGFSWSAEYARRWSEDPVFSIPGGRTFSIFNGEAVNVQGGHVFENNVEPSFRYTQLWANRDTLAAEDHRTQYTLGLSKYITKHAVKVQTDITFDERRNPLERSYSSAWVYRLQMELGI